MTHSSERMAALELLKFKVRPHETVDRTEKHHKQILREFYINYEYKMRGK